MSDFNFIGNFLGKVAKPVKDGHDMSAQFAYSLPFGTISVVDHLDVVPGEHYKVNYSGYVQTAPMREDNFTQIFNNMKAVFVPRTSMLRNYLDQMKHNGDKTTRKNTQFNYTPFEIQFPIFNALVFLYPSYFVARWYEDLTAAVDNIYNVFYRSNDDHAGFFYYDANGGLVEIMPITAQGYDNVAWEALLTCFYQDSVDQNLSASIGEIFDDWLSYARSASGNLYCYDGLRLLDAFDYGNYAIVFDCAYKSQIKNVYPTYITMAACTAMKAKVQPEFHKFDLPGYLETSYFKRFSSLHLYEYQFYVRSCEKSNYRSPSTDVVTYDSLIYKGISSSVIGDFYYRNSTDHFLLQKCLNIGAASTGDNSHYPIRSFLFRCESSPENYLYYSAPFDTDIVQGLTSFSHITYELRYLFSLANPLLEQDLFTTMQNNIVSGSVPTINPGTGVDVQGLNELSAAFQLQQDLLRAGVRRDKQMKSMFGVGVDELTNDIYVLDQSSSQINIQGLLNQAETEVAELGERGARGNGSSGLNFEFDSKDFGTIIILQWFTAEMFYESFGVDKLNRISFASDWLPQNNNLGLEAVQNLDCTIYTVSHGDPRCYSDVDNQFNNTSTLGFSARYFERKQRVSKARGLFTNFAMLENPGLIENTGRNPWRRNYALVRGNAAYGGFVPTLIDQQCDKFSKASDLYYNPFMVNNIFSVMNDGAAHGSFEYDQFRCFLNASVHKVSPMPKLGLYRLI